METEREWLLQLIDAAEKELMGEPGACSAFLAKKHRDAQLHYLPSARQIAERDDEPCEGPRAHD